MNKKAVQRAWEDIAETYAQRRDPNGSDADLVFDLQSMVGQDATILDVGCGDGARTLDNLSESGTNVGLDIARQNLELAHDIVPTARLLQAEMTQLPIASDSIDAITAYHAVFHVPRGNHSTVYNEFTRVLRPGGTLLMTLPGGRYETVRRGWMGGEMLFSAPGREQTLTYLQNAGFDNIRTRQVTDPLGSNAEFVFADLTESQVE
ncbi:class I SAM-dependent methyltransferase [Haloquadratum walsbyi]|jgi:ubiquinone/menaquinone biosynthesis C-methylase UbiE|uniref:Probable S-adenosylmethionine-dependent methyltransferase n=2 Tax=Haloquadratum walsbyi TaxID=293091 RepID=Q18J91_HALWD|nr:class I SAM-dependent methyltransferase [Haloquadratum walsbyi]CAJ51920.1 probable S-adenosylmethionine-dependent methyltransferase [Haloquadratum walsbyi DSM 16790]CCC39843.1 probable S-adenosylmethionine-dependent methyltransferase [Haloquadratum walsbyi C23]